jgi:hypothetical protein
MMMMGSQMKTSIERAWDAARDRASGAQLREGGLVLFRVDETASVGSYGGVDELGQVLLAIEVDTPPPLIPLESAALDYFRFERTATRTWLMALRLKKSELTSVFARLCQDLIDRVTAVQGVDEVMRLVRSRIALWKKLFDADEAGVLQDFQIKGLIGELLFLESQLHGTGKPNGTLEVICGWVGPSGADQDFIYSARAVEVKSIAPSSQDVTISSLEQLSSPLPLMLHIRTLRRASPQEAHAVTLSQLAARIEAQLISEPTALQTFRDALLNSGYVANPHYDTVAFESMLTEEFQVDDSFPRLVPRSVPPGINAVTYTVSLRAIRQTD